MAKNPSLVHTLLSAATTGLVGGAVVLFGMALGAFMDEALASPAKDLTASAGNHREEAFPLAADEGSCDEKRCESESGSFERLETKRVEVEEELVARGKTNLQGATRLGASTEIVGPTKMKGPAEVLSTLKVERSLTVADSLSVAGDLRVKGKLEVEGALVVKGKMSFPSKEVSCVDKRTGDRKDKVCSIGNYSLCVPTRQSGICELKRGAGGAWSLTARNPRTNMSPSMCTAVCW